MPLSHSAVAILQALPRIGNEYVLTTNGEAPSSNYGKNKRRLDALLPDCRHGGCTTFGVRLRQAWRGSASICRSSRRSLTTVGVSFAGIVCVYQRHTFADEKRQALQNWGAFVDELVSGRSHRNVVRLKV